MPFASFRPRNYYVPARWRTRFAAIDSELAEGGALAEAFAEAERLAAAEGHMAAELRIDALVAERVDLFPGEAGAELAWAILARTPPPLWRPGLRDPWQRRNIFEDPVPEYRAPFTNGTRRLAARDRGRDQLNRRLRILEGEPGKGPKTFKEAADAEGLTSKQFGTSIDRLRRHGVGVPSSDAQAAVVNVLREMKAALARSPRPRRFLQDRPYTKISVDEAQRLTRMTVAELEAAGAQTWSEWNVGDTGVARTMVRLPAEIVRGD